MNKQEFKDEILDASTDFFKIYDDAKKISKFKWFNIKDSMPPCIFRVLVRTWPQCTLIARIGEDKAGIMRWVLDCGTTSPILLSDKWMMLPE